MLKFKVDPDSEPVEPSDVANILHSARNHLWLIIPELETFLSEGADHGIYGIAESIDLALVALDSLENSGCPPAIERIKNKSASRAKEASHHSREEK